MTSNPTAPHLRNLLKIDDDITDESYGYYPDKRPIELLLEYGLILVDKPAGPSSHEIVAWIKKILGIQTAGHSGTLDPGTTGLLPIGLGEGTKALSALLLGPKEYYAVARMHSNINQTALQSTVREFTGEIFQRPPQRSSVRRTTRVRSIYEFQILEQYDRLVLLRVLCQSGTYIRKMVYDLGEILKVGATMIELRRTRVSNLSESTNNFTKLHDFADGFLNYKEKKDDFKLRRIIRPIEHCLEGLPGVIVRDSAVDALCHGAQLAVPGVIAAPRDLAANQLVGVYSMKGEIIGFAESAMSINDIKEKDSGIAFQMKRIILKPNTYPRAWRSSNRLTSKTPL